jgi:hypothetical protein
VDPLAVALVGIGAAAALGARSDRKEKDLKPAQYGVLTPARKDFFEKAMREKKSPEAFRACADQFDAVGLALQAKLLRARADSRAASRETIEQRRMVVRQVFLSTDPKLVREGAAICDSLGMTATAERMREYASRLEKGPQ